MTPEHDIVVVGSALVGGTLALALDRFGYDVAVVDAKNLHDAPTDKSGIDEAASLDSRTTALAFSTKVILAQMDLWALLGKDANPISDIQVSQKGRFGTVRLSASQENVEALGYVIDNSASTTRVHQQIRSSTDIIVYAPARVEQLESDSESVTLSLNQAGIEKSIKTRLVLAVDGVNSTLRSLCGISVNTRDYEQHAVISNIQTELPNHQVAFERFTSSGPLALLPLSPDRSSLIYTVDNAMLSNIMQMDDNAFLTHVRQLFGSKLGRFVCCSPRVSYPLVLTESAQQFAHRVLMMGNAARTLHPVAGQGFNLAIRDVGKLLELLGAKSANESREYSDPGREALLREFCSVRRSDQNKTVMATDMLARIFRGNSRWFSHIRALGIVGLDTHPLLRSWFAETAMGRSEPLPDLTLPVVSARDVSR